MDAPKSLRLEMRHARQALSKAQQTAASEKLLANLQNHAEFCNATTVALYLAADGEIDPVTVIDYCWRHNKQLYLPVLDPDTHNQLLFVHYQADTPMRHNKYQIFEPAAPYTKQIAASELDLVLLPLVAFDASGARMGMGGGYYDRSFAFKANAKLQNAPLLIGLAHQLQQVAKLEVESWDVPLAGIVTDRASYRI